MTFGELRHRIIFKSGCVLLRRERWRNAAFLLAHAVRLNPRHWESHNNLAIALLKLERWEHAAGMAQRAISLDPASSDSHAYFGIALLKMERWEEAVEAYHRAIRVDPSRHDNYERLGMALNRLKRWDDIVAAYQAALKLNPNSHTSHNVLGVALKELGRYEDAAAAFQRAIELVPNDPAGSKELAGLLIYLANAVGKLDRSDEAVSALKRAAALSPNPAARLDLGVQLLKLQRWEEAEATLKEGSTFANLGAFHYLRVDPLLRLGRLDEALAAHREAMALGGPMPPLAGEQAKARFERKRDAFWTPGNLGADVFRVERWLDESSAAPPAPAAARPGAKLLFVLDNDYGELTTLMYFVLGQPAIAGQSTLLLPDRLYAHNTNSIPGRTERYGSLEDVMRAVDRDRPDVVFLCSAYLFCNHQIFSLEALEQLVRLLRERGCRVVTSDPFLGLLSRQDPRTLISIDIPQKHPVWTVEQLTKAKRADEEIMWKDFSRSEKILRDTLHLYPSWCDVSAKDATRMDERNLSFFNASLIRPQPQAAEQPATGAGRPHWLFILSSADYDTQLLFEGEETFCDIVATKLVEAVAAGRHPVLIGPNQFVNALVHRMPTAEGIDILTYCSFPRFLALLLSAEYAFYWNVVSHSLLIRLFNELPIVLFDRGHLVRNVRPIYERVVGWYYQGWEPPFRSHREPLTLETVTAWSEEYLRRASHIGERFRRAPSPEQMIADLMGRGPLRSTQE